MIIPTWTWEWDDDHVAAFDFETSGTRPEYALQPWRIPKGDAWATSLVWLWPEGGRLHHAGGLNPTPIMMHRFLEWVLDTDRVVFGWNTPFDISVLLAYGMDEKMIRHIRWMDGKLLWRHVEIEPEYDDKGPIKHYGLKDYVREFLPQHAGYEDEIDFHDPDPAVRAKLHLYNIEDNIFTLKGCRALWGRLGAKQRRAAWIEAQCLPRVARANLDGLLIDTIAANDLALQLYAEADVILDELLPSIANTQAARSVKPKRKSQVLNDRAIAAMVVASPQKMATLLFDDWGLPVYKFNPVNQAGERTRSTDKETLYELSFTDKRTWRLRDFRTALNCAKKFALTPVAAAEYNGDGRAHPQAIVFGTYSGRFTYASKQKASKKGAQAEVVEAGEE